MHNVNEKLKTSFHKNMEVQGLSSTKLMSREWPGQRLTNGVFFFCGLVYKLKDAAQETK